MLAAMLFHMIRTPCAVYFSAHRSTHGDFLVHCVNDFPIGVHFHVRDFRGHLAEGQRTGIIGLPA